MLGHFFAAILLFALVQARAIITNECQHNVWIWSVPFAGSSHTENVPIKPGGQYQERWRLGSLETPGIAIKISTQPNGIDKLADEIDFAYSIKKDDKTKVWVDLSSVRGEHVYDRIAFHSCVSGYYSANVDPHECDATDEVELVLCGTARTIPATDSASLEQIQACYQPNTDGSKVAGGQLEYRGSFETLSTGMDAGGSEEHVQNAQSMRRPCHAKWCDCSACHSKPVDDDSPAHEPPSEDKLPSSDEPPANYTLPSSVRPSANDSKPAHMDKVPVAIQCQAKVVYPARRSMRASPVVRNTPIARREPQVSLCEILHKYHPDVKDCNEEAMKAYARALYPRMCSAEHATLLMGFECEDVAKELKRVYPGVADASEATGEDDDDGRECECAVDTTACVCASGTEASHGSRTRRKRAADERICLSNFCEPTIAGIDCGEVGRSLEAIVESLGASYADIVDEDPTTCPPVTVVTYEGRPLVCISELCALLAMDEGECAGLQALLKVGAKAVLKHDIEFSMDKSLCGD